MGIFEAVILAIVEGLTEFLPISSTGHMIIVSTLMGISTDEFTKLYTVCIQFGAILSVIVLYWKRFFVSIAFYIKLFVAFIPIAILGKLFADKIDLLLENVVVVAINLLLGGIVLLFIDNYFKDNREDSEEIDYLKSFKIGLFQCIALAPGVSRSAATIIGGMTQKLSRKAAAEFSFLLAVPTMFAATAYKMFKGYKILNQEHLSNLIIGNIVAFVVALIAIKFFISFLTKYGFKMFGYYRIVLGLVLLGLLAAGVDLKIE